MSDVDPYQLKRFNLLNRYKTPSIAPVGTICRALYIPNDVRFLAAINELISMLTIPDVWEESGISIDETLILAGNMWLGYVEDECIVSDKYALIQDVKSVTVAGGTFTAGAWRTRDLTQVTYDDGLGLTVSSNTIQLLTGKYRIKVSAPAFAVNRHQIRLFDQTVGDVMTYGTSEIASSADIVGNRSFLSYSFEVPLAGKTIRIEHRAELTRATNGFGASSNLANEIYTQVELWQIPT